MNFKYRKKEMECRNPQDRRLVEIAPKTVSPISRACALARAHVFCYNTR